MLRDARVEDCQYISLVCGYKTEKEEGEEGEEERMVRTHINQ